jgi:hypothetical protein
MAGDQFEIVPKAIKKKQLLLNTQLFNTQNG